MQINSQTKRTIGVVIGRQIVYGSFLLILMSIAVMIALIPLDMRMKRQALERADRVAERSWIKISAQPMVSKAYPNGNGAFLIQLRADDPLVPDQKLLVYDDDLRGQKFLAMQNGCRVRAVLADGQQWRSRALAYNYLDADCVSVGGPAPDTTYQQ